MPCPGLQFLDLSTSGVLESEVEMLLVQFTELNHIIVDDCLIFRGDLQEGSWSALGKRLALIGVKRSREREKALKAWLEASIGNTDGRINATTTRRIRPGRSGLATATISLRGAAEPAVAVPLPRPTVLSQVNETAAEENTASVPTPDAKSRDYDKKKGKGKVKEKQKPKSKRSDKAAGADAAGQRSQEAKKKIPPSKIRVLPALPTLKTLSITLQSITDENRHAMIRSQFEEGWAEGIAQLGVTRGRLRTSSTNGYRIMRSSNDAEKINNKNQESSDSGSDSGNTTTTTSSHSQDGLFGLEDIDKEDLDAYGMPLDEHGLVHMLAPVLCFGGPHRDGAHVDNCGHSIGWEIMKDEL